MKDIRKAVMFLSLVFLWLISTTMARNYESGNMLLNSNWHQAWPYNSRIKDKDYCPDSSKYGPLHGLAPAGCMAVAAGQVMRHWAWPPGYDWANMPNELDENLPKDDVRVIAVGSLIGDIGIWTHMDYGCKKSDCSFATDWTKHDVLDAYEDHFRYGDKAENKTWNPGDNDSRWLRWIKRQLNRNHPIQYAYGLGLSGKGHSVVVDGWRESGGKLELHVNDGNGNIDWKTLRSISEDKHEMIYRIKPNVAIGPSIGSLLGILPVDYDQNSSEYPPYRYFDQDATGANVTFGPGHKLQFLPGVAVQCNGGSIKFKGTARRDAPRRRYRSIHGRHRRTLFGTTHLFSRGDTSKGIKIIDGCVCLNRGGNISFPK